MWSYQKLNTVGKLASQDSTYEDGFRYYGAGNAVDGIYIPSNIPSLTHTLGTDNPWWRVDLNGTYCVWAVNVLIRSGQML